MSVVSEDIGFLLLYILPGFISFEIIKEIILIERDFKEFESIMYSFIFSTLIFAPFAVLYNITSLERLKSSLYSIQNMFLFIIIGLLLGFGSGFIYRLVFMKDTYKGNTWDKAFNTEVEKSEYISIQTTTGLEYQTEELIFSEGKSPHEVLLMNASLIKRNDDFKIISKKELKSDIFLESKFIQRISFDKGDPDNKEEPEKSE